MRYHFSTFPGGFAHKVGVVSFLLRQETPGLVKAEVLDAGFVMNVFRHRMLRFLVNIIECSLSKISQT